MENGGRENFGLVHEGVLAGWGSTVTNYQNIMLVHVYTQFTVRGAFLKLWVDLDSLTVLTTVGVI